MEKYFVDTNGNFLGIYADGAVPEQDDVIEVPVAPESGRQKWDGSKWLPLDDALLIKDKLAQLDNVLPRWAEDLVDQGGYTISGEAKSVYYAKKELRKQL